MGPFNVLASRARKLRDTLVLTREEYTFTFLRRAQLYRLREMNWDDPAQEKLRRYCLHYFDLLVEGEVCDPIDQAFLLLDWVAKHPDDRSESWEPYVIARRACRWIPWLEEHAGRFPEIVDVLAESLFHQGRRLHLDIEDHLQANHLFADLKALFLLSVFFQRRITDSGRTREHDRKRTTRRWGAHAVPRLLSELASQFLADGAHEERSPMYHSAMMRDVADIANACDRFQTSPTLRPSLKILKNACHELLPRMRIWLQALTHPDRRFALFQDAAFNGFPGCAETQSGAVSATDVYKGVIGSEDSFDGKGYKGNKDCRDSVGDRLFEPSGYFVARRIPLHTAPPGMPPAAEGEHAQGEHYLAVDVGEPGPSHQPGHAHSGMLTFELSLWGRRVIVDTGCGSYQNPRIRAACRGTSGHNVPMIEGCEQSDIWGEFRMGRRARMLERCLTSSSPSSSASPSIDDGVLYCMIEDASGNRFERHMRFTRDALAVTDRLITRVTPGVFQTLLHLAPDARPTHRRSDGILLIGCGGHCFRLETKYAMNLIDSCYYPEFGLALPNFTIRLIAHSDPNENANGKEISYVLHFPS